MAITAKDVQDLRTKTGAGMMECKKALSETNGDMEEAIKFLREKGLATAAKKADRIAAEGIVDILFDEASKTAVMVEVNAETDFVAKNDEFQALVQGVLKTILNNKPADVDALLAMNFDGSDITVDAAIKEKIAKIGENMSVRRFEVKTGALTTYIHGKGSIGVIATFDGDTAALENADFAAAAKNVALQITAMSPLYLDRSEVPASIIDGEKEILLAQIKNDPKTANKPQAIIDKMVEGRIAKYYETNCLVDQAYVKDDALTIAKYIDQCSKDLGGKIEITGFVKYEKGEGIQKREDNFAEEIAQLTGQK